MSSPVLYIYVYHWKLIRTILFSIQFLKFYDFIFRALRRWETLKNEVVQMEQSHRTASHRGTVTSSGNTSGNDQTIGTSNIDGTKSSRMRRRSVHNEETKLITPLTRVLPERLLERTHEKHSQRVQYRKRTDLKLAFSEFYLMLVLLQNYQSLNFTGFRKILKKHDKLFQTTRGEEWR